MCANASALSRADAHWRLAWVEPGKRVALAFRLPPAKVDHLRSTLDKLIADNPGVRPEKLISAHVEGDNGEGVFGIHRVDGFGEAVSVVVVEA